MRPHWNRRFTVAVIVAAATALAIAGALVTNAAAIYDPDTDPAAAWVIDTAGGGDVALDVAVNSAGTAYVCGMATNAAGNQDGTLNKFPPSGAGWRRTWDGAAHGDDAFTAVATGPGGVVYTAGYNRTRNGRQDMRLVKWSKSGAKLWSRRYAGPVAGDDWATDVVVDGKGSVTVCGASTGNRGTAFTVVSWSASGKRRWVRRFEAIRDSPDEVACANGIVVDKKNNLYVAGYRGYRVGVGRAAFTVKLSRGGVVRWKDTYARALDDASLTAITERRGGGVFVCGRVQYGESFGGLVMRYTAAGSRQVFVEDWGDGSDGTEVSFDSIVATPTGVVAAAGSVGHDYQDHYHRYWRTFDAATGAGMATITWGDSTFSESIAAVAADAYGGLYFTGDGHLSASHSVFWTRRVSTLAGGGGWSGEYGSTLPGLNRPRAIATWRTTVWVVGVCYPSGGDADQLVLKYLY